MKQIDSYLTSADPYMTFDPSKALHFGQGYFPPYLVAIGHFEAIWPGWSQMTPAWPLTPAMHYTLLRGSSYQIW